MRKTLTDIVLRSMKPDGKQHFVRDVAFPGFGVRLSQKGTRSFFVIRDRKYHHLGKYPATTLAEARQKASKLDTHTSTRLSYKEAVALYLHTYVAANYRPRSAKEVQRLLSKITDRPLHDISSKTITDVLDNLPPSEANHTFGVLRTFLNWCERRELIARSPIARLQKPHKEQSRDRVLTPDEIKRVWTATSTETPFNLIIRIALCTGQRRGEIAAIKKEWLSTSQTSATSSGELKPTHQNINSSEAKSNTSLTDGALSNLCLTFPATITKNKREHTIPLTPFSHSLIQTALPLLTAPYNTWSKPKADLDQRSGVSNWTIHDLRRTVSTSLGEMGIPPHVIDRLLNHQTNSLHGRYNRHPYLEEMRTALEDWQVRLLEIVAD